MPVVDAHTHVIGPGHWPSRYYDQIAFNWAYSGRPRRDPKDVRPRIEGGLIDPEGNQMVADMDAHGVDAAVVMPIDWGPDFDEPNISGRIPMQMVHEAISALCSHHAGRLIPFGAIDPRRADALDVLADARTRLGARGLKLYPPMGWYPYDPIAFPIYDYCQSAEIPVLFHTGPGGFPLTSPRYADVKFLREVQSAFPRLIIWIGHAGGRDGWDDALSVVATGANSYLEVSAWIWDDTSLEDQEAFALKLLKAVKRVGAYRIIFGSDHVSGTRVRGREFLPKIMGFFNGLPERAERLGMEITPEQIAAIMGTNAAEHLRIS